MDDAIHMKIAKTEKDLEHDRFDGFHGNAAAELVGIRLEVELEIFEVQLDLGCSHYNTAQPIVTIPH